MTKNYIAPSIEVIEIELEESILALSPFVEGETTGDPLRTFLYGDDSDFLI